MGSGTETFILFPVIITVLFCCLGGGCILCMVCCRRSMRHGGTANPVPVVPPGGRMPVNPYPGVATAPTATTPGAPGTTVNPYPGAAPTATTSGTPGMTGPTASPSQYSGMYQSNNNPYGMGMGRPPPYGGAGYGQYGYGGPMML